MSDFYSFYYFFKKISSGFFFFFVAYVSKTWISRTVQIVLFFLSPASRPQRRRGRSARTLALALSRRAAIGSLCIISPRLPWGGAGWRGMLQSGSHSGSPRHAAPRPVRCPKGVLRTRTGRAAGRALADPPARPSDLSFSRHCCCCWQLTDRPLPPSAVIFPYYFI